MVDPPSPHPAPPSHPDISDADPPWPPRRSGIALTAFILGVLSVPLVFTVYLGMLVGTLAIAFAIAGIVATRHGRAAGRAMAVAGLVAGLLGLVMATSLRAYGLKMVHDCETRIGHEASKAELKQCVRDGV
jgi:hypothetical protein